MEEVRATGYGIVIPDAGELGLEEPEIIKQGAATGSASGQTPRHPHDPADIQAEVSPLWAVRSSRRICWASSSRSSRGSRSGSGSPTSSGRSFHELINEDLASKLKHMPEDAREKMRQTLEKIINEGSGGLICIIL